MSSCSLVSLKIESGGADLADFSFEMINVVQNMVLDCW